VGGNGVTTNAWPPHDDAGGSDSIVLLYLLLGMWEKPTISWNRNTSSSNRRHEVEVVLV